MGSLYSNQVRNSWSSNIRHGCSKAQMCLSKILHIITSIPPQESSNTRGFNFDIDLNIGLCPSWDNNESLGENSGLSACSFVGNDLILESTQIEEKVTNLESESAKVEVGDQELIKDTEEDDNRKEFEGVDGLGLLIEAAELISGKERAEESDSESDQEITEAKRGSKRNLVVEEEEEDTSPVVRSRRGRNQVLPYRYRDSVLDPWKRLSRLATTEIKEV